jgi:hypothetical protein
MQWLCLVVLFSTLPLSAFAQQPAREPVANHASEQEVRELFEAMHLKSMTVQMMENMTVNFDKVADEMMSGVGAPDEEDRKFVKSVVNDEMHQFMGREYVDKVMAASVPVYAKYLTSEDVRGIAQFYATPAGQNYLKAMPTIQQETMTVVMPQLQDQMAAVMADEQRRINDYMVRKYGKRGHPAAKKPVVSESE